MDLIIQHDQMDCGPACLAMVCNHYGKKYTLQYLRDNSFITRQGVSLLGITDAAQKIGFDTVPAKLTIGNLLKSAKALPCILHWEQKHFVVLLKIKRRLGSRKLSFCIADPGHGFIWLSEEQFSRSWQADGQDGVALFLTPTQAFFELDPPVDRRITFKNILQYLVPYKRQMSQVFLLLLLGSCITLAFPFLTQRLIDKGVNGKNMNLITILLLAQLVLYVGSITIEIIRNWLTLLVGTKISIHVISEYLKKVLQLPIRFFDSKKAGDFNQRIQDNQRIEDFLTSQSLTTLFSLLTFSVFFGVLWYYSPLILGIYLSLTIVSVGWSYYWLRRRQILDYFRFQQRSSNQEAIYEILRGVSEMKLNQYEDLKRREWEDLQKGLFKINLRILRLNQLQVSGFEFLSQVKNIVVTYFAATFVVKGYMTIGALLSVSYIVGQMNSPVNQLVAFFRSLQDARLSLERLNEVQDQASEEEEQHKQLTPSIHDAGESDGDRGIRLCNVSFQYQGTRSPFVLRDVSLTVPEGQITAIVGASGSGKTTLMKLLLRFYEPSKGHIYFNSTDITELSPRSVRQNCGVVMQDGYIFSDTIERNIATSDEKIDYNRLNQAVFIANIHEYIDTLPLKFKTKIGAAGNGLSGGQRQRILIARAVYKDPHYIFFDEATSALDADNEKIIHRNLQGFFHGRTVLIVAHRLSTVKNADQIIVLRHGQIVERGSHRDLVGKKADYYNLVRNQLELGE